jgi:hypothetical protein
MPQRPKTPTYYVFYLLFSQDTWRLLAGFIAALLLVPNIAPADIGRPGRIMLYVMVLAIGWAATAKPAQWITTALKKYLLGDRHP